MSGPVLAAPPSSKFSHSSPEAESVLNAMPFPVLVLDAADAIHFVNLEAQQFFETAESLLLGRPLASILPSDSPACGLAAMAKARGRSLSEHGVLLEHPRIGRREVMITAAPFGNEAEYVAMTIHSAAVAREIDNQLSHRGGARSVTAMAAMLAHEVKNPLAGIRGAAQLLEQTAGDEDRALTRLICDETDRIVALLARMEVFADGEPADRGPVNIHTVLARVRGAAQTGFGRRIRFQERYDPSLPPVLGHHDQLVQAFMNLIKNACEAAAPKGGAVTLSTAYQRGVSIARPGGAPRAPLPLLVTIADNGAGIPEDIRDCLFDPFITTKSRGSGLGLPLVAKIVSDHGGAIRFESEPGRTVFRVSLPVCPEEAPAQ